MQPIVYSNTYGEIILLQLVTAFRSTWTYVCFALVALVLLPTTISSVPDDASVLIRIVIVALLLAPQLVVTALILLAAIVIGGFVAAGSKALIEHTVTIDEQTIAEQTSHDATTSKWSGIHRVIRAPKHLFIYLTPTSAHVIPRRAVQDDWVDFCATALRYWRSARAQAGSKPDKS